VVSIQPGAAPATISQVLARHRLREVEAAEISLTGASLRLWRIPNGRAVAAVVAELAREAPLASIQPNYLYILEEDAPLPAQPVLDEYWLAKLQDDPALDLGAGNPVRVAVIDTAIDETHPDLRGAVEARFDAIGNGKPRTLGHGTAIAGAIGGRGRLKGVAPTVRILTARAFDSDGKGGALGSTFSIMKAIDWAAKSRARIVNMSFAGPPDPALHTLLAAAAAKGLALVGAAGNAGPKSPPLYPGADESVVAVSATDADDAVYPMANAGSYIAVAAPGVDVLLPAPNGGYVMETGTSISAALVAGVAALMLERRPEASPVEVKAWLEQTARPIGGADKDRVGAGLADARRAVAAAEHGQPPPAPHSAAPGF
jgi:subtilisin family serine protease